MKGSMKRAQRTEEEALKLFHEYKYLVPITVEKHFNSQKFNSLHGFTKEEILQYGEEGLYKGALVYIQDKVQFKTHAINHIKWNISNSCRKYSLANETTSSFDTIDKVSLDTIVYHSGQSRQPIIFHETIESRTNGFEDLKEREYFEDVRYKLATKINPRVADSVLLRTMGYTNGEIGSFFGVSHQAISKTIRENREKIVQVLGLEGVQL